MWQHRFYDFVVFTEKKRVEKLRYMHRNPVVRGLVPALEEWNWSSYRHYALGERGPVLVNEAQKAEMRLRGIACVGWLARAVCDRGTHSPITAASGASLGVEKLRIRS